ncbi:lipopolysaccharide assembly protein LapB [Bacteriovorax sp. Seq25_V]|uniref:tetratricopeptide repeat protein n=1 Tax=Bacteriovorax sp. Seq25_V TaxID=1201288 RepID=UPI00038A44F5|nr:tetratricopeptide repeat protein [Bacteriovorax sp. Seq25_V]EQC43528.1 tetratricopeptide repeat protein [Bacteriovorax sp. Seq25_V]
MLKNRQIDEALVKAKAHFEAKEFSPALNILSNIIEEEPNHSQSLFLMANIFHIKGEISKAIKAFKRVLEVEPSHTDAAISLSVLLNDIGQYEEARKIFTTASDRVKLNNEDDSLNDNHINKKFSLKHYEMAELYLTYNRYDEAMYEYNKAIKLDPLNLEARIKVAKVYAKKGFVNKAFDELIRLKNEQPNFLPGRIALGVLYYGKGDVLSAQKEWEKVSSLDPMNSEAHMYMNLSRTATETRI